MRAFHKFLFFMILFGSLFFCVMGFGEGVVYISDSGDGDGSKADKALGSLRLKCGEKDALCRYRNSSLYRGFEEILKLGGGKIVIVGEVRIDERYTIGTHATVRDFVLPEHYFVPVEISSVQGGRDFRQDGARLVVATPAHLSFRGEVRLEDVVLQSVGEERSINCSCGHCVFGSGISCVDDLGKQISIGNASKGFNLMGGERFFGGRFTNGVYNRYLHHFRASQIEVYSGVYNRVGGGILGFGGESCDEERVVYIQEGDAFVKIGGDTVVLGDVKVGSDQCSASLFGDSHLWIEGGVFHGKIEGVGQGGFFDSLSRSFMRIDGGDFRECKGIWGSSSRDVRFYHAKESVLDISHFDKGKLGESGLEKAIVRGAGYYSQGVMKIIRDVSKGLGSEDVYKNEVFDVGKVREKVVDYMQRMAEIRWTPRVDYSSNVRFEESGKVLKYQGIAGAWLKQVKGVHHAGLPYAGLRRSSLEEFLWRCADKGDGECVFDVDLWNIESEGDGGVKRVDAIDRSYFGVSCSSSIFAAWEKLLNGIDIDRVNGAAWMVPLQNYGILKVGEYPIEYKDVTNCGNRSLCWHTSKICVEGNREKLYEAYAQLVEGDAVTFTDVGRNTGHVRMVKDRPVIDKSDKGKSRVKFIEQTNGWYRNDSDNSRTGWIAEYAMHGGDGKGGVMQNEYSFQELFDKWYIPVRHRDMERGIRERVLVRMLEGEDPVSILRIREGVQGFRGTVMSNYRLYRGVISIDKYSADGKLENVISQFRYHWGKVNKHGLLRSFHHRMIPIGDGEINGDLGYYAEVIKSIRGENSDKSKNVGEGRYRYVFHVMVGEEESMVLQDFDFVVGEGAYRSVIYDANGASSGEVPVDNHKYSKGQEAVVLGNIGKLHLEGYVFDGWSQSPQGGDNKYSVGSKLRLGEGDLRLYAQWRERVDGDEENPDDGKVDDGKVDDGKVDDGKVDDGKVDDGKVDDGKVDDGKVDDGKDGQGVDQKQLNNGRKIDEDCGCTVRSVGEVDAFGYFMIILLCFAMIRIYCREV